MCGSDLKESSAEEREYDGFRLWLRNCLVMDPDVTKLAEHLKVPASEIVGWRDGVDLPPPRNITRLTNAMSGYVDLKRNTFTAMLKRAMAEDKRLCGRIAAALNIHESRIGVWAQGLRNPSARVMVQVVDLIAKGKDPI